MKLKISFLSCMLFFIITSFSYSVTTIKVMKPESNNDLRQGYYLKMLVLSLEKTKAKYGDYKIENVVSGLQFRTANLLANGSSLVDVMWTMTNIDREKIMLPVRIPLLKGLMGYRILIINKKDTEKFLAINRVEELKKMRALQGHDWPDTDILLANGFQVEKSTYYDGMFKMINGGRVDYFPRAINEPFDEIKKREKLNLTIEKKIRLYYFAPIYFFVNVNKPQLRDRIEKGLEIAIVDGSFDKIFYSEKSIKNIIENINNDKIKLFKLENPFLTEETKKIQNNKKYILDINFKRKK